MQEMTAEDLESVNGGVMMLSPVALWMMEFGAGYAAGKMLDSIFGMGNWSNGPQMGQLNIP